MDQKERDQRIGTTIRLLAGVPDEQLGLVQTVVERLRGYDREAWAERVNFGLGEPLLILRRNPSHAVVPAIDSFDPCQAFKVVGPDGGWIRVCSGFDKAFLTGDVEVETNIPESTLRVHSLWRADRYRKIFAELGGEKIACTTLSQMYRMILAQIDGQEGDLLLDNRINVFFIRDKEGEIWVVSCQRYAIGSTWELDASAALQTNPDLSWLEGERLVSN